MARKDHFKQAINEALDLEMRRDPTVILLGRTSSAAPGRPARRMPGGRARRHQGLHAKHGNRPARHAPFGIRLYRCGGRGRRLRHAPGRGIDVPRFHGGLLRPDPQSGRQVQIYVRRQGEDAGRHPRHGRGRLPRRRPAFADADAPLHPYPGLKVVCPSNAYDAKGLLIQAIRDDDPDLLRAQNLYGTEADVPEESYAIPFGGGERGPRRQGRDDRQLRPDAEPCARRRRRPRPQGTASKPT